MNKVVLVLESWGRGGTESYVKGLTKALLKGGWDVSLVLLKGSDECAIDFIPHEKVFVRSLYELPNFLRHQNISVANLHLYTRLLPVTLICRSIGIPAISTLHMPINSWGWRHRLYWKVALSLSYHVLGVSRVVLNQIKGKNVNLKPLPGGVDGLFFSVKSCSKREGGDSNSYNIFAVGRLSKEKDWPTLVKAVAMLPDPLKDRVTIFFYGDGPLKGELQKLTDELCVSANFKGFVSKERLAKALGNSDLSVLPSLFEGLGLSAVESMAASVPTITADFEASQDFICQGETGHTFPVGDSSALSQLISWHARNPLKAAEIGSKGRQFISERYSEEMTYLPYLELLKKSTSR